MNREKAATESCRTQYSSVLSVERLKAFQYEIEIEAHIVYEAKERSSDYWVMSTMRIFESILNRMIPYFRTSKQFT